MEIIRWDFHGKIATDVLTDEGLYLRIQKYEARKPQPTSKRVPKISKVLSQKKQQ